MKLISTFKYFIDIAKNMESKTYWLVGLLLMAIVMLLYLVDLFIFLTQMIPVWYFAPDEAFLEEAYYSSVNKQTMEYATISLVMAGLFAVSIYLFYTRHKYGFYVAALSGMAYLAQLGMALATMIRSGIGEFGICIGTPMTLFAVLLLVCVWKSKPMFEAGAAISSIASKPASEKPKPKAVKSR